jgi:hypothetical protein
MFARMANKSPREYDHKLTVRVNDAFLKQLDYVISHEAPTLDRSAFLRHLIDQLARKHMAAEHKSRK